MKRIVLEVAIGSAEDALAARGGADRLELNGALALGGLTPSLGLVREVRAVTDLPLIVMARPRPGGFCYRPAEYRVLCHDIDLALEAGADGVAFGVLLPDGRLDRQRCAEVMRLVGGRQAVFHRAFDVVPDPLGTLEELIDLGVRRVMTSGQEMSAYNGSALIAELIRRAAGRIEVLPAGGINRFTVADVLARTGCDQVHASLRKGERDSSTAGRPQVTFGAASRAAEDRYEATSAEAVREMRAMLG